MFDNLRFYPFVATVICVRAKVSVRPLILDDVVMHVVVKGEIFEFIGIGPTKNGICYVSRPKTGLSLLKCTRPAYHMRML